MVIQFLEKRVGLLDGVVITGGEPTLRSGLMQYLAMIKAMGYKIKLDTNGSSPDVIKQILSEELCDYFAVDYKAPASRYKEICGNGANADVVLETIRLLQHHDIDFEVRTTVIPQLSEADLLTMAKELPLLNKYVLNRYRKPEKFIPSDIQRVSKTPYSSLELQHLASAIAHVQPNVKA
jgi:pyruvate formate lyase activating enzyme